MNPQKRPWTRLEKSLVLAPLLIAVATGAIWLWRERLPAELIISHALYIETMEWAPDSRRLAVTYRSGVPSVMVCEGAIYDIKTRSKICVLNPPSNPTKFWYNWPSWSPDGSRLVAGYSDNTLGVGKHRIRGELYPNYTGKIALWNAWSGTLENNWLYAPRHVNSDAHVRFSSDGQHLIGYGEPPTILDANTGLPQRTLGSSTAQKGSVSQSHNFIALQMQHQNGNESVEVRDAHTAKLIWKQEASNIFEFVWGYSDVLGTRYRSKDGKYHLVLWSGKAQRVLPSPPYANIFRLRFAPSAPIAAIADVDLKRPAPATVALWNYETNKIVWSNKLPVEPHDLDWSPNGNWLCIGGSTKNDKRTYLYFLDEQGVMHKRRDIGWTDRMRWAPDSQKIAIALNNKIDIMPVYP